MGHLRINNKIFDLPQDLCGRQYVITAVMQGTRYVGVAINGARFDFGKAAMRILLQELSNPACNGDGTDTAVHQALDELRHHFTHEAL